MRKTPEQVMEAVERLLDEQRRKLSEAWDAYVARTTNATDEEEKKP